jgi:hypothetical protein
MGNMLQYHSALNKYNTFLKQNARSISLTNTCHSSHLSVHGGSDIVVKHLMIQYLGSPIITSAQSSISTFDDPNTLIANNPRTLGPADLPPWRHNYPSGVSEYQRYSDNASSSAPSTSAVHWESPYPQPAHSPRHPRAPPKDDNLDKIRRKAKQQPERRFNLLPRSTSKGPRETHKLWRKILAYCKIR